MDHAPRAAPPRGAPGRLDGSGVVGRLVGVTGDAGLPEPDEAADTLMLLIEGATVTALVEDDRDAAR